MSNNTILILGFILLILLVIFIKNKDTFIGNVNDEISDVLSDEERHVLDNLTLSTLKHLNRNNVPYFMAFGSLIGAARHGQRIPWDDDIDIIIPKNKAQKLINDLEPNPHPVYEGSKSYFLNKDTCIECKKWGVPIKIFKKGHWYPFIDIYTSEEGENDDIIIDPQQLQWGHLKTFREPKSDIFPLRKAKFGNFITNIPQRYETVLKNEFGDDVMDICYITWDHKNNGKEEKGTVQKISLKNLDKKWVSPQIY